MCAIVRAWMLCAIGLCAAIEMEAMLMIAQAEKESAVVQTRVHAVALEQVSHCSLY